MTKGPISLPNHDSEKMELDWRSMSPRSRPRTWTLSVLTFFLIIIFYSVPSANKRASDVSSGKSSSGEDILRWCPLPDKPEYKKDGLLPSFLFVDSKSVDRQVARLSKAVNVPTVSWDDNGDVGVDKRWESFFKFHDVLEELFPLV
jgi:Gly-Xaa carboxypeptidase